MPVPKDPEKYEEWRRKLSERAKERAKDPTEQQRLSEISKGRKPSAETIAKRAATTKERYPNGVQQTPEGRERTIQATRGKTLSPEQRAKISAGRKGIIPNHSEEGKVKIAEARARTAEAKRGKPGHRQTAETRAKIGAAGKGRPRPDMEGKPAWNRGMSPSEAARAKMRAAKLGSKQTEEHKAKIAAGNKGKVVSEDARAKIGRAHRGKEVSEETRAKFRVNSYAQWETMTEEQKAAKLELLRRSSESIQQSWPEDAMAQRLDAEGIEYERQKKIGWYRIDFYVPAINTIIEVNGCYWHQCEACGFNDPWAPEKRLADQKRYDYLVRKGYQVQIIWEHNLPPKPRGQS